MNPTLLALKNLGGQAHIREIEDEVAKLLNLTPEEIGEIHSGSRTELNYRLAWSRNYLKRFGLFEKVARGIWALTPDGYTRQAVNKDEVLAKVRDRDVKNEVEEEGDESILLENNNSNVEREEVIALPAEDIEKPFDPKKIDITSKQMIFEAIFKRMRKNQIDLLTGFQRKGDLWDITKQSRLIESILIRFPLPAFYFDGTNDDKWLVVDGLQRLSSLKNFVIDKDLVLENLEFLTQFNGKTFDELPDNLQRRIEEAEITVYIINPGTPDDVKYNVFKRINTGGLVLEPQEIRHALNQGEPATLVMELAEMEEFKQATCYSIKTERMLDRDFTTRFVSFYLNHYSEYHPDLDTFLNKSMADIKTRLKTKETKEKLKQDFSKAMKASMAIFDNDAFRKRFYANDYRKPINKALFEVWSVSLSKLDTAEIDILVKSRTQLKNGFMKLMNEDLFFATSLSSGTGDKTRVIKRFTAIEELIQNTLSTIKKGNK